MSRFQNMNNQQVLVLLLLITVISSVWSLLLHLTGPSPAFGTWGESWLSNLSTEMLGAIATFLLFQLLVGERSQRRRLLKDLGSKDHAVALNAVQELTELNMLSDGTLQKAFLQHANLAEAPLQEANLAAADLGGANLSSAVLFDANLAGAELWKANLAGSNLGGADLTGAELWKANLAGANLRGVNMVGANLRVANLSGADLRLCNMAWAELREARFNENTILPDETNWTPETDMSRFTDPQHPQFWRSDKWYSPAYRGDAEDGETDVDNDSGTSA